MKTGRRRSLLTIAASALVALVISSGVAVAGGGFTDVQPGDNFFNEIGAIADAGITTGFPDGTYRPSQPVTRGAMAAFMGRGFGRADSGSGSSTNMDSGVNVFPATASIVAGAAEPGTGGYVVVTASADLSINSSWCACSFTMSIQDVTGATNSPGASTNAAPEAGITATNMSLSETWIFPISAGQSKNFRIDAEVFHNGAGASTRSISGQITAVYVPFDGTGNAQL
jgi:hypothetical protein